MAPPGSFTFGDTTVLYPFDPATGRVGLELVPTALLGGRVARRGGLAGLPYIDAMPGAGNPPAAVIDPLAQVKLVGDSYPGAFAQGHTLRNSPSVDAFAFAGQRVQAGGVDGNESGATTVMTTLTHPAGYRLEHRLTHVAGDAALQIETAFFNDSARPVTLEMFSSFLLGGLTPFDAADASERLRVHRFRSGWSAEGRLETRTLEELHLERSWSGAGAFSERFGQLGSMPVRRWFPFVALEDTAAGVVWGAQLAWAGSWQMEVYRQHDDVSLSGGLADREFGHWVKTFAPGESLVAPPATVACVQGDLDALCDRLTAVQHRAADRHPEVERALPIVFNEWCTTWGDPRHDKVVAIADRLRGSDVRYLVIDAGWYKGEKGDWGNAHGDWVPSPKLFPEGLVATAAAIRARGLIPGLWFEMETVGDASLAFSLTDHLLKRDGLPVTVRNRRFWNLNDSVAIDYLTERVIGLLERGGFGYLKVDYNETIGLGCDGAESQGEGLRRQIAGVYGFFQRIRARLPDLVIESCSSGGHRLEPSMIGLTAMSSFSDAHELVEIPLIAANLHALMLPRQSQIWAVLHAADSDQRLVYSLAATFLGRMALSGDIAELAPAQWALVRAAQQLYGRVAPIIRHGRSRRTSDLGPSWRHPRGWQAVVRVADDGARALVVAHAFAKAPVNVTASLGGGGWRIVETFDHANSTTAAPGATAPAHAAVRLNDTADALTWQVPADFSACVVVLARG